MSAVEGYLAELRAALGDRLPPSVHTARLRETRAHLLASAEDVGEAEAIRRYGRARAVAADLVRQHRGYGERSAWSLALPLCAIYCFGVCATGLFVMLRDGDILSWWAAKLGQALWTATLLGFLARVVQTRRWLALPLVAAHVGVGVFVLSLNHAVRAVDESRSAIPTFLFTAVSCGVFWTVLNALALGLGRLLDRRRVHGARRVR